MLMLLAKVFVIGAWYTNNKVRIIGFIMDIRARQENLPYLHNSNMKK